MTVRRWMSTVVAGFLVLARPVAAQDVEVEFGGSSTFVSDYTFRGISQTDQDPAVQAVFADYATRLFPFREN